MTTPYEPSLIKICTVNAFIDIKGFFRRNFIESHKYFYLFLSLLVVRTSYKLIDPRVYFLRNNSFIREKLVKNHYMIRVKPHFQKLSEKMKSSNDTDNVSKNYPSIVRLKHLPHFYLIRKYIFREKLVENVKEKQLDFEDHIKINLSGLKNLSSEGNHFLEKVLKSRTKRFYIKFNNIQYMDEKLVYGWLLYKNHILSLTYINLNVVLVQNGLGEIEALKGDIFDEKIYFYYSDLVNADKLAKARGRGMWRNQKSHLVAESSIWKGSSKYLYEFIERVLKMKKWQKIILNKKNDD